MILIQRSDGRVAGWKPASCIERRRENASASGFCSVCILTPALDTARAFARRDRSSCADQPTSSALSAPLRDLCD
jgi:hypothetical protein